MGNEYKRNEKLERTFNLIAADFESVGPTYFTYFGQQLVMRSGITKEKKVLDVACGRGASLFKAIEVIGEHGLAIGIDFSDEMVKCLGNEAKEKGLLNFKAIKMDAESLAFKAFYFDYVFCGLSTHFFSNPLLAIDEMYRVLKSGGRVGISSWSIKRDKKGAYEKAYSRVFPKLEKVVNLPKAVRPDFSSIDGFKKILEAAGFRNVEIQEEAKVFYYENKDDWWTEQSNNATRGFFERIKLTSPELFQKFKDAAYEEIEDDMDEGRIKFQANVLYGYGTK